MSKYNWTSYASPTSCLPRVPDGAKSLLAYLEDYLSWLFSMGICNCRNVRGGDTFSHHANCRALDAGIPTDNGAYIPAMGDPIIELLGPFGRRLGLDHLILNRIIYSARSPDGRPYTGVSPHNNHAHIGLSHSGAVNLTYATLVAVLGLPPGIALPGDEDAMKRGDSGFNVAVAQKRLGERGFDLGAFTPYSGPVPAWWTEGGFGPGEDGDFGGIMETGVQGFQEDLMEPKTGVLTGVQAASLGMAGGTQGAKGDKGDKGATGSRGAVGAVGVTGAAGSPGANGADGADGADGRTGATGVKGATGPQGADGEEGPQGEPGVGLEPGQEIELGQTATVL